MSKTSLAMYIIKKRHTTYAIWFSQGKHVEKIEDLVAEDDGEIKTFIEDTFNGRFRKPQALSYKDGVRIVVKRFDNISNTVTHIMNTTIYNKSVRNARIEIEKDIRKL